MGQVVKLESQDGPRGLITPGLDTPGLNIPGLDNPGLDTPGLDTPRLNTPGLDNPALGPSVLVLVPCLTIFHALLSMA